MTPAKAYVRAVVVTRARSTYLSETLQALVAQRHPIDAWHLVVVGTEDKAADLLQDAVPEGMGIEISYVHERTFGAAVTAELERHKPEKREFLWLLHDDSAPLPDALGKQMATLSKRRSAGVVGATQVRWDEPTRLVNLGTTVSRWGARRLSLVEDDDINQGQYDGREDVLAVGLAGALVKRDLWDTLGGTDPAYGHFGDSTDFCRKVWYSGHDVVVQPHARVRHAQSSVYGAGKAIDQDREQWGGSRSTHAERRAAEWYHAMAWAPLLAVPFLAVWVLGSTLWRALLRVAANDFRLVLAELVVPGIVLTKLPHLFASRSRIASLGNAGALAVRPLLATPRQVARHVRTRELGAYEQWRAENTPSDVQRTELAALKVTRRNAFIALTLIAGGVSAAVFGTWIAPLLRGEMLVGRALGVTDISSAELWERTWTGWNDMGLGSASLDGMFAALMLPLSLVPGGLSVSIGVLLGLSILWAAWGAYFALGQATRSLTLRLMGALVWCAWPPFIQSVSDGRISAVIVHLALPLLVVSGAKALGVSRRDRLGDGEEFPRSRIGSPGGAAAAALVLLVITIAAPLLLWPALVLAFGIAVSLRGNIRRMVSAVAPSVAAQAPALLYAWHSWRDGEHDWWGILMREPGPALSSASASTTELALGVVQAPPAWPGMIALVNDGLAHVMGATLILLVAVALLSGRGGWPARVSWIMSAAALALAIVAHRTPAAVDTDGVVNGWPGAALSLMALSLLVGLALVMNGLWRATEGRPRQLRAAYSLVALVVSMLIAVHLTATTWPGRAFGGDVHPVDANVLPLVTLLDQRTDARSRVLVIEQRDDGVVTYSVHSTDGAGWLNGRSHLAADGTFAAGAVEEWSEEGLAEPVAAIVGQGAEQAEVLADYGIGAVVIPANADGLAASLQSFGDLRVMGSSDRGLAWRVLPAGIAEDSSVHRAWLQLPDGTREPLAMTGGEISPTSGPGARDRIVRLAVPASTQWTATLNGEPLPSVDVGGAQAFAMDRQGGTLVITYVDAEYRRWWWITFITLAWSLISAIPLHDRRFLQEVKK